jgi:hypothetical protein
MYHHQSTPSYSYSSATTPHGEAYGREFWPQPQGSSHPRSVPTPPIPNQPVKKSRVSTTPEPGYYSDSRRQDRRVTSPTTTSPVKEEPRGLPPVYDHENYGYYTEESLYPLSATTATSTTAEYYWDQYGAPRDGQERRSPESLFTSPVMCGIPANRKLGNYSTGARPSRAHSRHSNEEYDSADSRAAQTNSSSQYGPRRSHSMFPEDTDGMHGGSWSSRDPSIELVAAGETGNNAVREVIDEFFSELYNTAPAEHESTRHGSHASYYHPSSYMSPSRRPVDPSVTSPYKDPRSPPAFQNDRPRREYSSTIAPESLYPLPKSPMAHNAYTYGNVNHHTLDDNYDDFESEYDETDPDEDDDDDLSTVMIPRSSSPFYGDSSASPEGDAQGVRTKYSSPEITPPYSAYPRNQTVRGTAKKSSTSTSPRRPRKPIPTAASASAAATNAAAAPDKYDETDSMLVALRQQGVSYKTIKSKLNLDEAESTLRGRYRTLTKPKNERLRKPVWDPADVSPLHLLDSFYRC